MALILVAIAFCYATWQMAIGGESFQQAVKWLNWELDRLHIHKIGLEQRPDGIWKYNGEGVVGAWVRCELAIEAYARANWVVSPNQEISLEIIRRRNRARREMLKTCGPDLSEAINQLREQAGKVSERVQKLP